MSRKAQHKARQDTPRRKAGRGALMVIASLFLASGILRLLDGTGEAIAKSIEEMSHSEAEVKPGSQACETPEGIGELLAALQEREARIIEREARLKDRLKVLSVAETRLKQEMEALEKAESELEKTIAMADSAAEKDISRLTAMYENMKPKAAAALFAEMDPEFAAGFLSRMRPDAAAAIMAGLDPQAAYTISVVLAGRNANTLSE